MRNPNLFAIAGASLAAFAAAPASAANSIPWSSSWDVAIAAARKSHKLVMIDFYTDWCVWCKKLDKDTYPDPSVVKAASQFVPLKLNAEKDGKEQAQTYHVTGYPTIVFVDADGKMAGELVGYEPAAQFAKDITGIATAERQLPGMLKQMRDHPEDANTAARLAAIYAKRSDTETATHYLSVAETGHARGLGTADNAVGDSFQNAGHYNKALGYFQQAEVSGKSGYTRAYAHLSAGVCLLNLKRVSEAKAELQSVPKLKGVPADLAKMAQNMLTALAKTPPK
ncbi:MAG: thioredoxin family protein [Armatimonadetes bacterium]|nr:thioredoxin family protein [Armatimonadota bacterium]MDE2207955.1 thioredoxin family protein [Armatimonadota bacterium]